MTTIADLLTSMSATFSLFACTHDKSRRTGEASVPIADESRLELAEAVISARVAATPSLERGIELAVRYRIESGSLSQASLGLRFDFPEWSTDNYVLMPAAVYNGNRYPRVPRAWSHERRPLREYATKRHDVITVTFVPRLHPDGEPAEGTEPNRWKQGYPGGPSRVQLLTGDCSTPLIGIQFPGLRRACILSTEQRTPLGNTGISIFESPDRKKAAVIFKAPGVREETTYSGIPSTDRGAELAAGDEIVLRVILHVFSAPHVPALFERFFSVRNELRGNPRLRLDLPFASAWAMQERKYNDQNWVESDGYYSVGMRESPPQDWQSGWVGGPNCAYALLVEGDPLTRMRARRVWDFLAAGAVTPSGFIKSTYHNGKWHGDAAYLRYSADTLYFLIKSVFLLDKMPPHFDLPESWAAMARGLCDGFAKQYEREGRFVHFVDYETGETILGGSCAGGLAPAGLAMAARWFKEPRYLAAAEGAALVYLRDFVNKGITNGGPGDIFQCIDSESAAALLDSFVVLYEETGKREWLDAATKMAHQCASWTMSYDYQFPPNSTFGKLDMLTTGTVWANIQNKHSAPGICTLSGDSLLKLFRATGDRRVLDLLREIAHTIPQYLSRADRPIADIRTREMKWRTMPEGWINERVNTSDWEVRGDPANELGVGEIFAGSCWSEGSMLLTYAELPGIYLQTDTLLMSVLDHVYCQLAKVEPGRIALAITNPTPFDASVKLLAERSVDCARPLGPVGLVDPPRVRVPAGATVRYEVARH
jgi:hypothetical protein